MQKAVELEGFLTSSVEGLDLRHKYEYDYMKLQFVLFAASEDIWKNALIFLIFKRMPEQFLADFFFFFLPGCCAFWVAVFFILFFLDEGI